ncbi:MAG: cobalamin-dependent protein [Oscillospiraceae bacterium]|nr:cobalamin-dependent protein [Oscillospiraceae bacterium]
MEQYYNKLMECVLEGEEEEAVEITRAEIEGGTDPLDIVQKCLVPILDDVGDKFSKLEIFLPDLIMSADVAKAVKDEIRAHLLSSSNGSESSGKVVIGTVQGDVHDIGKNIVATLLEVNGYEVIDLGNDVAPYTFIETAKREKVDIIALSSLLTTSMPYMVDVLKTLDGLGIRDQYKVIVGGGPVSAEWAESIGADGYSNDANEAVELCRKMMAERKAG